MVQIIQEHRKPSMAQKLSQAVGIGLEGGAHLFEEHQKNKLAQEQERKQHEQREKENAFFKDYLGQDISGVQDPKMRESLVQAMMKERLEGQKVEKSIQEKISPIQSGLSTVNRMRELGKKGNLGRGSGVLSSLFGGETAKEYGEYEQLGKSLIQLSTQIPIRNQREFETLAHNLYDPSIPDSQREGILNAMEKILRDSMSQFGSFEKLGSGKEQEVSRETPKKERRPLSFFDK